MGKSHEKLFKNTKLLSVTESLYLSVMRDVSKILKLKSPKIKALLYLLRKLLNSSMNVVPEGSVDEFGWRYTTQMFFFSFSNSIARQLFPLKLLLPISFALS